MKLHLSAATTLPALALGYNTGGSMFGGRPVILTTMRGGPCSSAGPCTPSEQQRWVDRAFADLESEVKSASRADPSRTRTRSRRRQQVQMNEETIRQQQQEWVNRAFGMASDIADGFATSEAEAAKNQQALRQQQAWANRAFGVAADVAGGLASPRYEVDDNDETFQVALDVPGVKLADIEILLEDNDQVLTVRGQREMIGKETEKGASRTTKFSKSFSLDPTTDTEQITAQLNNGVLLVTAPKEKKIVEEKTKRIAVTQVEDNAETTAEGATTESADTVVASDDVTTEMNEKGDVEPPVESETEDTTDE